MGFEERLILSNLCRSQIPGDMGGPADATESSSMAALKRSHTEQQSESEDEEDNNDDNEKTIGRNPKTKKKYASSMSASMSSAKVKAEH